MNLKKKLADIYKQYCTESIPTDIARIVEEAIGVKLIGSYVDVSLVNPLMVAPGQLTLKANQIKSIQNSGFAGCVLKSVVGETPDKLCSMSMQRKKPTSIRSFYEPRDTRHEFPIIHWNGRCDARGLDEYMQFAREVRPDVSNGQFFAAVSIICHLPMPGEDIKEDEWIHTTKTLFEAGYSHIEIDFCPFLSGDNYTEDQNNVLRWYRTCPELMKSVSDDIRVIPKMLNLEWGLDFQVRIAKAAVEGGADGLVIANRIYKPEYGSGHGGEELRHRNLTQIREIRNAFPSIPISATGGVYTGRMAYEYLNAGADNVQVLSYIMGMVCTPFAKTCGNKFDQVFHKLLLDPDNGLIAAMLDYDLGTGK